MILIADSGSTKTSWCLIGDDAGLQTCQTRGINPFFLDQEEIKQLLKDEFSLEKESIASIYFYGAGCTPEKQPLLTTVLQEYFQTNQVEVRSDLWAAARSLCQDKEGIVCILGTGSNSCYYDGTSIVKNISPLGYILGDEGSGAVLGKKLIADILKNQLPPSIIRDFYDTYSLSAADILDKVYRQPFPNRFLAQFTFFIFKHIKEVEIQQLVENGLTEFIVRNVLQYEKAREIPIHFTGSIAFCLRDNLQRILDNNHLKMGNTTKEPLPDLIAYHLKKCRS